MDKYGYLQTAPLSPMLLESVVVWLDEGLYDRALHVLGSAALSRNGFAGPNSPGRALVPGSHFLALLATLSVHPHMTTYTTSSEDRGVSDKALQILQSINKVVGPVNADFRRAFVFSKQAGLGGRRISSKRQRRDDEEQAGDTPASDDNGPVFRHRLGQQGSLFERSEDFWRVLGWSMNCAARYSKRWAYWKHWLDFQITALEDDWRLRVKMWMDAGNAQDSERTVLQDSLIMQYLRGAGAREGRNFRRRIMRSIFAHGEKSALQEFTAIFDKELKEPQKQAVDSLANRKRVNLDEDEFGDYYDPLDVEEVEIKNEDGTRRRISARKWNEVLDSGEAIDHEEDDRPPIAMWGGPDALLIRQRILVLLCEVARFLPIAFVPLDDLMIDYTEFIKPLAPTLFSYFVRPPPAAQSSLSKTLPSTTVGEHYSPYALMFFVRTMLHAFTGKEPSASDLMARGAIPTIADLKSKLLDSKASTTAVADNAKVSYLVECVLRLLLHHSSSLQQSLASQSSQSQPLDDSLLPSGNNLSVDIDFGAQVRQYKVTNAKLKASEKEALDWLESSAAQLGLLGRVIDGLSASRQGQELTPKAKACNTFDLTSSPLSSVPTSSRVASSHKLTSSP